MKKNEGLRTNNLPFPTLSLLSMHSVGVRGAELNYLVMYYKLAYAPIIQYSDILHNLEINLIYSLRHKC